MNVRLAADNAGTVLKKYGKISFWDSSPEAADGETCGKNRKITKIKLKVSFFSVKTFHDPQPAYSRLLAAL